MAEKLKSVNVRFNPEEHWEISRAAAAEKRSVSDYIRIKLGFPPVVAGSKDEFHKPEQVDLGPYNKV